MPLKDNSSFLSSIELWDMLGKYLHVLRLRKIPKNLDLKLLGTKEDYILSK